MATDKKVALITGASGGIGEAISIRFINEGYKVYLNCSSQKSKESLETLCSKYKGSDAKAIVADVKDSKQVKDMVGLIAKEDGRLDCLVNNAGITNDTLAIRMSDEVFDSVIDVNLKGTFYLSREAVNIMMKAKSGSIINMSSVVGLHGNAGQCNYSASKAGIIGLTKSFAREYASRGIVVNAIAPGAVDTPMLSKLSPEVRKSMMDSIPLKRFAQPDEVAELVMFLANTKYITGQVLSIDGGMSI